MSVSIQGLSCHNFPDWFIQVKTHAEYDPARVTAFVADVTQEMAFAAVLQPGVIDVATLIFVLSAISPDRMSKVCGHALLTIGLVPLNLCLSSTSR